MSNMVNSRALASLPPGIERPRYDRGAVTPGIVHLGIGAFHRAHQAVYTDELLAKERGWGIIGASLRSSATRDALAPQDNLYTLAVRTGSEEKLRIIGAVTRVIAAMEERQALIAAMADPRIRIVSLTVTEKGYCHDPATGELNETHPDIVHDLSAPNDPHSVPGLIVEALRRRRSAGIRPFTVLCCDNLPSNGRVVKRVITRFARLSDHDLGAFVEKELACPSTMVDRITPATTAEDRSEIGERLGVEDAWPVITEPFSQWVIEDDFPSGRPSWEEAGAELVSDVEPYETMKLRLLNGSHSTLAYLGYLAGYETIADTMRDADFERLIRGLMDEEVTPTLHLPPGADLSAYKSALITRFRNPALKHRTWQIAMDGSQKLPQRLLGTIRDRLKAGAPVPRLALGVAAWMRYVTGVDEKGRPIDVRDPLASRLRTLADPAGLDAVRLTKAFLGVEEIFASDLPDDPRFVEAVTAALVRLMAVGSRRTVAERAGESA
jgi:fructuronate reductase